MQKTTTEEIIICNHCKTKVYKCDKCDDYIDDSNFIFCDDDNGKHFCVFCIEPQEPDPDRFHDDVGSGPQ